MIDLSKLKDAAHLLAEWLVDNTDHVFEEQPEIDGARADILDFIEAHDAR
jgi:hypothetical protein